jgi:hypothetical protein
MQESQFLIHGNGKDKPPTGFMFEKQQMKGLYFNQSPTKVCYKSIQSYCHCFYNHPATFAMYFMEIHSDTLTQINMGNSSQHCMASIWPTFPATLVYNKLLLVEWKPTIVCHRIVSALTTICPLLEQVKFNEEYWLLSGCCVGHGFNETHSAWSRHGEAIIVP